MNLLRASPDVDAQASTIPSSHSPAKFSFLRGNFRLLLLWPALALLGALIGWSLLLAKLDEDRNAAASFALSEVGALSRSYANHLKRSFDSIDQTILHVKLEWSLSKGKLDLLQARKLGLFPESAPFHVAIIDRNGMRKTSTFSTPYEKARNNVSDRPYFVAQKEATGDFLYIGAPTIGRITGVPVVHFSRTLYDENDNFDGVVLISVKMDYFTTNYDEATFGRHGLLAVVGVDGAMRAARIGNQIQEPEQIPLILPFNYSSSSGNALLDGNIWFEDRRNRYVGWQLVDSYPFLALAGLDQQTTLASYAVSRAVSLRYAAAATIILAVFTLIAMSLSLRLAWRKQQLKMMQATYRIATESGNEGFYICRPICDINHEILDFKVIDCNRRGAEFFDLTQEEFIGKSVASLHDRATVHQAMILLKQAMIDRQQDGELILTTKRGKLRCLHLKALRSDTDLAVSLRDVSDEKAHMQELERRGNEDVLTKLPNRQWAQSYLPEAIRQAGETSRLLALLFIDLDGFKAVNDSMGHAAGDELLVNAALRLKDAVRPNDYVVRFGGDEFVVILEHIAHEQDAAHIAQRVLQAFREGFRLSQGIATVGTSIGISVFPNDAKTADGLLEHADIAMYSVKTSGKRHFRFFDSRFYEALRVRLEREAELRAAIERDEFVMYYQPRVDITTGRPASMEALLRWNNPVRGLIEPDEFIPLAEETGLILDLGHLAIGKVCAQLEQWTLNGQEMVPVSVNVSPRQFNEMDMARVFTTALSRHGVAPGLIEIELTESTMMGTSQGVSLALNTIHNMGIKLLVDDFGTGYSSLSQLQRLDVDILKVDRAFTAEIEKSKEGNVFFTAIITMAHALGMRVVAEGVETECQLNILRALACDEIQGFYVSPPLPPDELPALVKRRLVPEMA